MRTKFEKALAVLSGLCFSLGIFFVMCSANNTNSGEAWLYLAMALMMMVCATIVIVLFVHEENRRDRFERWLGHQRRLDLLHKNQAEDHYE